MGHVWGTRRSRDTLSATGYVSSVLRHLPIASAAFGLGLALSGCTDADPSAFEDTTIDEPLRLARVHIDVGPSDDLDDADFEQLAISARFAFVQALDEDFVRARVDMPLLANELLAPGQCSTAEALYTPPDEPDIVPQSELILLDAGNVSVEFAGQRFELNLSLTPDLLPYMSGVEYLHYGEPNIDMTGPLTVESNGTQADIGAADIVPPFRIDANLPRSPDLAFFDRSMADLDRGSLVLHWAKSENASLPLLIRFTSLDNDIPVGQEVLCSFADEGSARIDLDQLRLLGLSRDGATLRVEASRADVQTFDVGHFVGSELVVERRSKLLINLSG